MDSSIVGPFYAATSMADYASIPQNGSGPSSSLFSTSLPSIINMDPIHNCSPFPSADLLNNEHEQLWRGSSIASLRRKAVEYQVGTQQNYKWSKNFPFCVLFFFSCLESRFLFVNENWRFFRVLITTENFEKILKEKMNSFLCFIE